MSTFKSHINRALAIQYGLQALQIINSGGYYAPSGKWVELRGAIDHSTLNTVEYKPDYQFPRNMLGNNQTLIEVKNETTLSAALRMLTDSYNPVILNFANGTHAGGGFLNGARAQEEYLVRSSTLYACLKDQPMYAYHRELDDHLSTSYMLYSPEVTVFRGDEGELLEKPYPIAVITAPAPIAYNLTSESSKIKAAYEERVAKVLWIGLHHGHDAIVLGAWGCGAFGNDGWLVSRIFKKTIRQDFSGAYRKITFAIVDWSKDCHFIHPFEDSFSSKKDK